VFCERDVVIRGACRLEPSVDPLGEDANNVLVCQFLALINDTAISGTISEADQWTMKTSFGTRTLG